MDKPLEEQTLAELKQTATNEGIQGVEVFNQKAQVITIINTMRNAKAGIQAAESAAADEQANQPASDPTPTPPADPTPVAPLTPMPATPPVADPVSVDGDPQAETPPVVAEPAAPVPPTEPTPPVDPTPVAPPAPEVPPATQATPTPPPDPEAQTLAAAPASPVSLSPVNPAEEAVDQQVYKKDVERVKSVLDDQPKIRILVPLEVGEKRGDYLTVIINGLRFDILKGVYVDVPNSVADVISDSYNQTAEVGKDLLINRADPETGKAVADSMGLKG